MNAVTILKWPMVFGFRNHPILYSLKMPIDWSIREQFYCDIFVSKMGDSLQEKK